MGEHGRCYAQWNKPGIDDSYCTTSLTYEI
jgi:hypothetical protein